MRRFAGVFLCLTACGRLGFDPSLEARDARGDNPLDDENGVFAALCEANVGVNDATALGDGTPSSPYVICNYPQLASMADAPRDASYRLGRNIDLRSIAGNHVSIGTDASPFTGSFDGGGLEIRGYRHIDPTRIRIGFFGVLNAPANLARLQLTELEVHGLGEVGGLVGLMTGGSISQVFVSGMVRGEREHVGGLVGEVDTSAPQIEDCASAVNVAGSLSFDRRGIASLVGHNEGTISRSYAIGDTSGFGWVGSLAGVNENMGAVRDSFSAGAVTSSAPTGEDYGTPVGRGDACENCFYAVNTECNGGSSCDRQGTAIDLDSSSGYFGSSNNPPLDRWNFESVWREDSSGFPRFVWQQP